MANDNILVPKWFLESLENTLRIQYNINKIAPETCQTRNIKGSLNGVRKLLAGEELSGMERLEKVKKENITLPTYRGWFPYTEPSNTIDGEIANIWSKLKCDNCLTATKDGFEEIIHHFYNWTVMHLLSL